MFLKSINPSTEEILATYAEHTPEQIQDKLIKSKEAYELWKRRSFPERSTLLIKAADLLETRKESLARLIAKEMGKPLAQGIGEIEKCALNCRFYAEHGPRFLTPEQIATDAFKSYISFEPLGPLLALMPWNYPFWQVIRFAAPALLAGNSVLLKHASNVSGCSLAIEQIFKDAGFPENLFLSLLIPAKHVAPLITHPFIQAITLTGSTEVGRTVAAQAGQALKKVVLELGGSDPFIILEDADLDSAVQVAMAARFGNTGQSCIAAKRFIIVESLKKLFEDKMLQALQGLRMGDPLDTQTTLGPLARIDLRDALHRQVAQSISKGAVCLKGGQLPECRGAFYPATLLSDVKPGMAVYDEETFGPVAAIIPVSDEEQAIRVANDTPFGLGATVFTRDLSKGESIAAHRLEAGSCFVNQQVRSDPRLPFGGIKASGYGRELSHFGIREFVNIKTVVVGG